MTITAPGRDSRRLLPTASACRDQGHSPQSPTQHSTAPTRSISKADVQALLARAGVTVVDPAAVRVRRQAAAALNRPRVTWWLALVLYGLRTYAPKGTSATTARAAALMAVNADFGSGARCRPGKTQSAELLNVSPRTIQRHWRILEDLEVAHFTCAGRYLDAQERADIAADPNEQTRWRNRQEWTLIPPPWVSAIPETARPVLEDCRSQAEALLEELTTVVRVKPLRGAAKRSHDAATGGGPRPVNRAKPRPLPTPEPDTTRPVDNRPPSRSGSRGRVSPSVRGSRSTSYVTDIQWFPCRRAKARTPHTGASRSSTKGGARPGGDGAGRQLPREAVQLAHAVLARGRMPWLVHAPRPLVVSILRRFASAGWTARDIEAATAQRLADRDYTMPASPFAPAAYLRWLLSSADVDQPPAQLRDADLLETVRRRQARHAAEHEAAAARRAKAAAARHCAPRREVAAIVHAGTRRNPHRKAKDRAVEATERALGVAHARGIATCVGCHTSAPDVELRAGLVLLCPPCWNQQAHMWT